MADRVEAELGLRDAKVPPDSLGSIDTFRFEERALLAHCGELIAAKRFDSALAIITGQEHSFWLDRDVGRKAQWEACRRMAELGRLCVTVREAVSKAGGDANAWIDAYTSKDGWFHLDQAQRRLEAWVANLDDEPQERPLGIVRNAYEEACRAMADGFTRAMMRGSWTVSAPLHQTHIYGRSQSRIFWSMLCASRWALNSLSDSPKTPKSLSGPRSVRCQASHRLEWRLFSQGRLLASAL
jgi:hypothetical protein